MRITTFHLVQYTIEGLFHLGSEYRLRIVEGWDEQDCPKWTAVLDKMLLGRVPVREMREWRAPDSEWLSGFVRKLTTGGIVQEDALRLVKEGFLRKEGSR